MQVKHAQNFKTSKTLVILIYDVLLKLNNQFRAVCVCVYIYIYIYRGEHDTPLQYSCLENPTDKGA